MKKHEIRTVSSIQNVFVWLLLALFAIMSTLLVAMGAQAYKNTVEASDAHSTARILDAVIRTAVRSEDGTAEFMVTEAPGIGSKVLNIIMDYDGELYKRSLYCVDGYLMENFSESGDAVDPEAGESLCKVQSFDPVLEGNLLTVKMVDGAGQEHVIRMTIRTGGAAQ